MHVIVRIQSDSGGTTPVDMLVARFKADVARAARRNGFLAPGQPLWQRGFFDRVIRSDQEFSALVEYIETNPLPWTIARGGR